MIEMLMGFLILGAMFAIFDAVRRLNNNILEQTEEIKKLRNEITRNRER